MATAFVWQMVRPPSLIQQKMIAREQVIKSEEWQALMQGRDFLPRNAVILSNNLHFPNSAIFSGVMGRTAFLEYLPGVDTFDKFVPAMDRTDSRLRQFIDIWQATAPAELAKHLPSTVNVIVQQIALQVREFEKIEVVDRCYPLLQSCKTLSHSMAAIQGMLESILPRSRSLDY